MSNGPPNNGWLTPSPSLWHFISILTAIGLQCNQPFIEFPNKTLSKRWFADVCYDLLSAFLVVRILHARMMKRPKWLTSSSLDWWVIDGPDCATARWTFGLLWALLDVRDENLHRSWRIWWWSGDWWPRMHFKCLDRSLKIALSPSWRALNNNLKALWQKALQALVTMLENQINAIENLVISSLMPRRASMARIKHHVLRSTLIHTLNDIMHGTSPRNGDWRSWLLIHPKATDVRVWHWKDLRISKRKKLRTDLFNCWPLWLCNQMIPN